MSNMSYCMFENTLRDLRDCLGRLEELDWDLSKIDSKTERQAAKGLVFISFMIGENRQKLES